MLSKRKLVEVASVKYRINSLSNEAPCKEGSVNLFISKHNIGGADVEASFLSFDSRPFVFYSKLNKGKKQKRYHATHARNLIYVFNKYFGNQFANDIFRSVSSVLGLSPKFKPSFRLASLSDKERQATFASVTEDYICVSGVMPLSEKPSSHTELVKLLSSTYSENDVSIKVDEVSRTKEGFYYSGVASVKWRYPFNFDAFKFKSHFNGTLREGKFTLNFSDPAAWASSFVSKYFDKFAAKAVVPIRSFSSKADGYVSSGTFIYPHDGVMFTSILNLGKPFKLKKAQVKAPKLGSPRTDWPMAILPPKMLKVNADYFDYWAEAMLAMQRGDPELQDYVFDFKDKDPKVTYADAIRYFYRYMRDTYGVLDIMSYIRNEHAKQRGGKEQVKDLPEEVKNQIAIQADSMYSALRGLQDSVSKLKSKEEVSDEVAKKMDQFFKEANSYDILKSLGIKTFRLKKMPTVASVQSWIETLEHVYTLSDEFSSLVKDKAKSGHKDAVGLAQSFQKLLERALIYFKQQLGISVETPEEKDAAKKAAQPSTPFRRRAFVKDKKGREGMVTQLNADDETATVQMVEDGKKYAISWDELTQLEIPYHRKDKVEITTGDNQQQVATVVSVRPNKKTVIVKDPSDYSKNLELKWDNIKFIEH